MVEFSPATREARVRFPASATEIFFFLIAIKSSSLSTSFSKYFTFSGSMIRRRGKEIDSWYKWTNEWMHEWMNEWMNGQMNEWPITKDFMVVTLRFRHLFLAHWSQNCCWVHSHWHGYKQADIILNKKYKLCTQCNSLAVIQWLDFNVTLNSGYT